MGMCVSVNETKRSETNEMDEDEAKHGCKKKQTPNSIIASINSLIDIALQFVQTVSLVWKCQNNTQSTAPLLYEYYVLR